MELDFVDSNNRNGVDFNNGIDNRNGVDLNEPMYNKSNTYAIGMTIEMEWISTME